MKKQIFILAGVLGLALSSCTPTEQTNDPVNNNSNAVDVYIAGSKWSNSLGTHDAVYWKNGVEVQLTNGNDYANTSAIHVKDNIVYAVGSKTVSGDSKPTLWTNGVETILSNNFNSNWPVAIDLTFSGNDLYILGSDSYWKNGIQVSLPATILPAKITVVGNDVYVIGSVLDPVTQKIQAVYSKNGQLVLLPNLRSNYSSYANGLVVLNNDVYVSGVNVIPGPGTAQSTSTPLAVFWKNGTINLLDDVYSSAAGIELYNNDVYIYGNNTNEHSCYWKNGQQRVLSNQYRSKISSIGLSSNGVFCLDTKRNSNDENIFWTNGIQSSIQNTFTNTNDIFTVQN